MQVEAWTLWTRPFCSFSGKQKGKFRISTWTISYILYLFYFFTFQSVLYWCWREILTFPCSFSRVVSLPLCEIYSLYSFACRNIFSSIEIYRKSSFSLGSARPAPRTAVSHALRTFSTNGAVLNSKRYDLFLVKSWSKYEFVFIGVLNRHFLILIPSIS